MYDESVILPRLLFFAVYNDLPGVCEGEEQPQQLVDGVREEEQPVEPTPPPMPPSLEPLRGMRNTAAFHQSRRNEGQR